MPSTVLNDRDLLNKLLSCPVDWVKDLHNKKWEEQVIETFSEHMNECWYDVCRKYQVDMELRHVSDVTYSYVNIHDDDLKADRINVETWIEKAKREYLDIVRKFQKLKMATSYDQKKHFPDHCLSDNQILNSTAGKSSASIFYKSITPSLLEDTLWAFIIFDEKWKEMVDKIHIKYYIDTMGIIGCTHGEETSYICYDIDLSTPIAHAYPISAMDFPKDVELLYIDNLQGEHLTN